MPEIPTNRIGIGFIESTIEHDHIMTFSQINDITSFQKYKLLNFYHSVLLAFVLHQFAVECEMCMVLVVSNF